MRASRSATSASSVPAGGGEAPEPAERLPGGRLSPRLLAVLAVLFAATACALVVNQRIKQQPALVRGVGVSPAFSPNGDGDRDEARISVTPGRRGRVVARILDARGQTVRVLRRGRRSASGRRVRFRWDGLTGQGRPAPAGTYRVRLVLRRRGATVELRKAIRLDRPGRPA